MRVCLDTNAYSLLVRGHQPLRQLLEEVDEILVPATVVGELMFGFLKGGRLSKNESALRQFLDQDGVSVLTTTADVAERYGYVKAALKAGGTPIPENDIWIAAAALESGARLVTYDNHFAKVGGLVCIAP